MTRSLRLAVFLPLLAGPVAGCGGSASLDGIWVGDVTPRTPGPACTKTRGLAQIHGDRLTFSPNEGTWMLVGTAAADGQVVAERIGTGANKQPYETKLEGRWTSTSLSATYTTPRCIADVVLRKQ